MEGYWPIGRHAIFMIGNINKKTLNVEDPILRHWGCGMKKRHSLPLGYDI